MIDPQIVQRLRTSRDWIVIEEYMRATVASLDTVADIQGDERLIALEVLSRQRALSKLKDILQPFVDFREKPDNLAAAQERAQDAGL
jgi:hypothetical protein